MRFSTKVQKCKFKTNFNPELKFSKKKRVKLKLKITMKKDHHFALLNFPVHFKLSRRWVAVCCVLCAACLLTHIYYNRFVHILFLTFFWHCTNLVSFYFFFQFSPSFSLMKVHYSFSFHIVHSPFTCFPLVLLIFIFEASDWVNQSLSIKYDDAISRSIPTFGLKNVGWCQGGDLDTKKPP